MKIGELAKLAQTQSENSRFYEREGYTSIPNFGYYADSELSRCYEKLL